MQCDGVPLSKGLESVTVKASTQAESSLSAGRIEKSIVFDGDDKDDVSREVLQQEHIHSPQRKRIKQSE